MIRSLALPPASDATDQSSRVGRLRHRRSQLPLSAHDVIYWERERGNSVACTSVRSLSESNVLLQFVLTWVVVMIVLADQSFFVEATHTSVIL